MHLEDARPALHVTKMRGKAEAATIPVTAADQTSASPSMLSSRYRKASRHIPTRTTAARTRATRAAKDASEPADDASPSGPA